MSNELGYSAKKALSLWVAKNNYLVHKWTRVFADVEKDIDELYGCKPSTHRDCCIRAKEFVHSNVRMFLDDLRKPCDAFISEFERVNHDEGVFSKELDIALSFDLKEHD